jgi:hypothetical protein
VFPFDFQPQSATLLQVKQAKRENQAAAIEDVPPHGTALAWGFGLFV